MAKAKRRVVVRFRESRKRWEVDYQDHRGRHRPLFDTEPEALTFAAEIAQKLAHAIPVVADLDITLCDYATQRLEAWKHQLAARTLRSYAERLTNHVLPALGHLKMREIRRRQVKALLTEKQKQAHSTNSVRLIRAALSTLLSDAVDDEIIQTNPTLALGKKKGPQLGKLTKAEGEQKIRPMTREHRDAFLAAAAAQRRYVALFATMAKAGVRPSEALALKPGDINFSDRALRVERALDLDGKDKPTKSYDTRTVDLTPDLAVTLKRHLTWVKAEALRSGSGEPERLFPNEVGKPLDESKMVKAFHRARKRAGLPSFRVYDLRHTFASLLLPKALPSPT